MNTHTYLERIHYQGSLEPSLETLRALHEAHLLTVSFENLSIHYGQPIILQEEKLYNKIVEQRRGGFCYELNGMFAWLLRQLGFEVAMLAAGVAHDAGGFGPEFDHMLLLVSQLDGADWLADVGFGDSYRLPLRFEDGLEQEEADGRRYRVHKEDSEYWTVQQLSDATWKPYYRFTLQPRELADFTEMCHYQQTSPESHFTQKRICSLALPTGRVSLSDMRLITTLQGERTEHLLASQEEYAAVLAERFGIILP